MPKKDGSKNLSERNTNDKNLSEENNTKTRAFAFILYPDDDKHMKILSMLSRYPQMFRIVYILHDKDVWTSQDEIDNPEHVAGSSKKPHIHVLCYYSNVVTASAFSKNIGGIYCQRVSDINSYLRYMIHDTFDSWDKAPYTPDKMFGDSKLISRLAQRNSYYIQLQTLCHLFDSEHGLRAVIDYVAERPEFQETFERFQYLIVACNTDERARTFNNKLIDKYIEIN